MGLAVGIDLGTTNTVVAAVRDGAASALSDANGTRLLPSVVSITDDDKVIVGTVASSRRLVHPQQTIYGVKRLIGRPWGTTEVERAKGRFPYRLVEGEKSEVCVFVRGERYTLPEISAFVLRQAKLNAEAATGEKVDRAVITVPASFNEIQRGATKLAAELAGLEVLRILHEPTAAALSYGSSMAGEVVAVYDLGGGTFDFTLLHVSGNVFEVLGTGGDSSLGGDDIDHLLAERIIDELHKQHKIDAFENPNLVAGLQIVAERLKCELSTRAEAKVELNQVLPNAGLPRMLLEITREDLDAMSAPIIARSLRVCEQALETAGVKPEDIARTILVGGATRQPLVRQRVEALFGKPAEATISPDEVVALGASIHAASLDRTMRAGPATAGRPFVAGAPNRGVNSARPPSAQGGTPAAGSAVPRTELARIKLKRHVIRSGEAIEESPTGSGRDSSGRDDPHSDKGAPFPTEPGSSSRALGPTPTSSSRAIAPEPASSQRGFDAEPGSSPMLDPEPGSSPGTVPSAPLLIDVTPLNLGVETAGGYCDPLIEANTPIPCDRTRSFATAGDDQTSVIIRVAQGSSMRFEENAYLGEVELKGLERAPRGEIKIRVTFELDANGILSVKAKDGKTGTETQTQVRLIATRQDEADRITMRARQEFMVLR